MKQDYKARHSIKWLGIKKNDIRKIHVYQTPTDYTGLVEIDDGLFESLSYDNEDKFNENWEKL